MGVDLLSRLKKASKIELTSPMNDSKLTTRTSIDTGVPAINIVMSGTYKTGYTSGVTVLCGESRTFKSMIALICAKAYMDKFDDAVLVFYDSEMGAGRDYFESVGIDTDRVLHVPITDIEMLKFDIVAQLQELNRGDHVIFVIDSVGNLASKKETQDAIDEKSVADMSRAKALKSLFRLVTPQLNFKDLPCICISHTYKNISSFIPTDVLSGGTGILYSADTVINITRASEKQGSELVGYNFNMNVMKSRHSREKARVPLTVLFNGGVNVYSGLLEMGLASGLVTKPSNGWYQKVNPETGEIVGNKVRAADTNSKEFWSDILNSTAFESWVKKTFSVASGKLLADSVEDAALVPDAEFTADDL